MSILNTLNTKSNIIYCKNTEDHSKTGFYADYVVDLIFLLKYSQWVAPTSEMVPVTKTIPVRVLQPNGSYEWVDQQVTVMEVKDSKEYTKPAEGEIRIKITEKSKNEKVTRKTISSVNNSESDLKLKLILQLEIYLIEQFSK